MLTIEQALSQYTEEVLAGNDKGIDQLIQELSCEYHEEFLKSARLIRILHYQKAASKFDSIFDKVNKHKEAIYDAMPHAVDFRGEGDRDTVLQIEAIFNEEFADEP